MSEISNYPVETFTIGFSEKSFDERDLAKEVAQKFKTNHHEKLVSHESFDYALNKVLYHYDEPFGDSSAIPTNYVSNYASERVKMVLTGDGGDEVLSGYNSYLGLKIISNYNKLPGIIRKGLPITIKYASKPLSGKLRYTLNRIKNVSDTSSLSFNDRMIEKMAWTNKDDIKTLIIDKTSSQISIEEFFSQFMSHCPFKDDFYKMMYLNLKLTLPDDMLVKVDRMSMANSLEARIPFLDHRLIEFMASVHKEVKLPGSTRKSVLRNTVGKKLPPSLLKASKKGFVTPLREWYKEKEFNHKLSSLYIDDWGFNQNVIKSIVQNNNSGTVDNGNFIWMLFVLKGWLEKQ